MFSRSPGDFSEGDGSGRRVGGGVEDVFFRGDECNERNGRTDSGLQTREPDERTESVERDI